MIHGQMVRHFAHVFLLGVMAFPFVSRCSEKPLIFPVPVVTQLPGGECVVDSSVIIAVPENQLQSEQLLTGLLVSELADRYGLAIRTVGKSKLAQDERFILAGSLGNPLVAQYCDSRRLTGEIKDLGDEGYLLAVSENNVVIAAKTVTGALHGVESLRQIIKQDRGHVVLPQCTVKDKPRFPFRGVKLYLPGRENIPFFKRFIRDFVALYKFNTIILELNANMRLERHPELNVGAAAFAKVLNYSRLSEPNGINNKSKNSTHHDNAAGEILEKEEVADLVRTMREFHIEVIPELPSLPHSYYLLAGHRDLAENKHEVYPDTYCPLRPEVYKLYFDVLDEYIDVIHPQMVHVGHDEWRMEKDECELCKGKDYGELFANDLTKIHDYLASKGIKTAMWGDHLIESVRGKDPRSTKSSSGYAYKVPGALRPEQVEKLIPKDILVFNWFWDDRYDKNIDAQLSRWGFKQVYGNMRADFSDFMKRSATPGVLGGAPSSWAATTEKNFGKDQLLNFLGCANILWSEHLQPFDSLVFTVQALTHDVCRNFTGKNLPAADGYPVDTLDISSSFNSSLKAVAEGLDPARIMSGNIRSGDFVFHLSDAAGAGKRAIVDVMAPGGSAAAEAAVIPVGKDVSSIVFLHACAKNAANRKVYYNIYNFDETADLLGMYEIVYEDGFMETIPIRYGVNILDWGWRQRIIKNEKETIHYNQDKYVYAADAVPVSNDKTHPITFFAHEWKNPRFGELIKEIRLKRVVRETKSQNTIMVLAVSVVCKGDILNQLTGTSGQ
jgi:hypothetical protein